jgi:uncharacterized membrane protein YdjX (TVP38/TMEM64 family)
MSGRTLVKILLAAALVAVIIVVWRSPLGRNLTRDNVRAFVEHLRGLWYGPAAFIGLFAAGCVVALPASVFVIAAGFIWGWAMGGIYAYVGGLVGAIGSFFMARFIGEGMLDRFGRVGKMVASRVDHAGFGSMLLLRFIPGIPFVVLNYGAGVAGVRFSDFLTSTAIGIIPPMFVFTYCADAVFNGSMTERDVFGRLVIVCALMLALVLLPRIVRRLANGRSGVGTGVD